MRSKFIIFFYPAILLVFSTLAYAATPGINELKNAVNYGVGCSLIPYANRLARCISEQEKVHVGNSCDANKTLATCDTITQCVNARVSVQQAFESTIKDLNSDKKNIWKGDKNKGERKYANKIIDKITVGQPNHQSEIRNAKTRKANLCK